MGKAWKALERQVAEVLGCKRNIRVGYHDRACDIESEHYVVECKYGKQVPKYLMVDVPTLLCVGKDKYYVLPNEFLNLKDGVIRGWAIHTVQDRDEALFIQHGLAQARGYSDKEPVLCVKRPRQRGFVAVVHHH